MSSVRTRFAPSPTGYLHIGGVRTALFCWLYARHHGGQFILRIEDTDRERSTQESVDAILQGMEWMGLSPDEGPFYQTDRIARYQEVLDQLLDQGLAYKCYCTQAELDQVREDQRAKNIKPRYNRKCRDAAHPEREGIAPVIRFRNPLEGSVIFEDLVRGKVNISNDELDDLVIARGDGMPTYNFAVVVDDIDMEITHVIRGDDHVNNTPRQVNIFKALKAPLPIFAHLPMIVGQDGQRLSKRHGAVSVLEYRDQGFLPEAMRNYLLRLGWSHGDQEIFSTEEMIELFDLAEVNRAASAFDVDKLKWLNQHYIKEADSTRLTDLLLEKLTLAKLEVSAGPPVEKVVTALRERAQTIDEFLEKSRYFYSEISGYEEGAAKKHLRPVAEGLLVDIRARFESIQTWTASAIHEALEACVAAQDSKLGKIAQPLRVAVSGTAATPPIDETLELVGKVRTLSRIDAALAFIEKRKVQGA
ncbi:glutamate--tRNA ligase [Gammaproteobacteria bacterium]|nr:glutamate--tRNA ligase [Pseudomonadota bacterium]MDB4827138.1 glutamate--tRNA ligase [Gammaproteobacteria bacterium]MBT5625530.1 glutamate--tRNA ligase [Pseudomonadota bacterium]MBT6933206.1 glutamate--tRNA ligase [Pseudomonadota bacterium]MBT7109846.1 glutamate--tRNA ligase [Pseudomonadota bacterium]